MNIQPETKGADIIHPITSDAQKYLDTMSKEQLELHHLAVKMLGSSYFLEGTRGYLAWKASLR